MKDSRRKWLARKRLEIVLEGIRTGCGLAHDRIHPHCPEENGKVERLNRTIGEMISNYDMDGEDCARRVVDKVVRYYNEERLHSSLFYLTPTEYYRGELQRLLRERREAVNEAREHRRKINMGNRTETAFTTPLIPAAEIMMPQTIFN